MKPFYILKSIGTRFKLYQITCVILKHNKHSMISKELRRSHIRTGLRRVGVHAFACVNRLRPRCDRFGWHTCVLRKKGGKKHISFDLVNGLRTVLVHLKVFDRKRIQEKIKIVVYFFMATPSCEKSKRKKINKIQNIFNSRFLTLVTSVAIEPQRALIFDDKNHVYIDNDWKKK